MTRAPIYSGVAADVASTIAAYAHAWDDGLVDDVVALYCDDATIDLPGIGVVSGLEAIERLYSDLVSDHRSRHVFANTHVSSWTADTAVATSDLIVLGGDPWSVQAVGRYVDTFRYQDGAWLFHTRTLTLVE
ncbi:nuclear transport factor 2 family protein [Gordonia sp. NPDC127522]|uniref:nuclear transport factor 2 family protein n=1 Tax=Gordonia sp. NPDC127522 TaxID=3345390 RepID=UPI00363D5848